MRSRQTARRCVALAVLLSSACSTRLAVLPPPPGTEAGIAEAERLGRMMLVHDVAAARATDESHVFLSLHEGVPFAVATSLGAWVVEDGRIRYLGANEGGAR